MTVTSLEKLLTTELLILFYRHKIREFKYHPCALQITDLGMAKTWGLYMPDFNPEYI
jgi:hypothetical protein